MLLRTPGAGATAGCSRTGKIASPGPGLVGQAAPWKPVGLVGWPHPHPAEVAHWTGLAESCSG